MIIRFVVKLDIIFINHYYYDYILTSYLIHIKSITNIVRETNRRNDNHTRHGAQWSQLLVGAWLVDYAILRNITIIHNMYI